MLAYSKCLRILLLLVDPSVHNQLFLLQNSLRTVAILTFHKVYSLNAVLITSKYPVFRSWLDLTRMDHGGLNTTNVLCILRKPRHRCGKGNIIRNFDIWIANDVVIYVVIRNNQLLSL